MSHNQFEFMKGEIIYKLQCYDEVEKTKEAMIGDLSCIMCFFLCEFMLFLQPFNDFICSRNVDCACRKGELLKRRWFCKMGEIQ